MARLIYSCLCSLDGYVEDMNGEFGWAAPSEEVHAFVNELERPLGTYLYGRGMYETMMVWETMERADHSQAMRDYAEIWRAAEKIVYSRTLEAASSPKTRIERELDPEAVRSLKAAADRDLSVGGAGLAASALAAGLVDECHLLLSPLAVGGGKRALPERARLDFELLGERRFDDGVVHLHYRVR